MDLSKLTVWSVGHSTLPYERFLQLIRQAGITAIADVRSAPYSRHFPHFSREALRDGLKADGIAYVFLGDELGGRPKDRVYFLDGVADYEKMAAAPSFELGLQRVIGGAERHSIALMCSEQHPLDCHRCLLVGRALKQHGVTVNHILPDGHICGQDDIENELLGKSGDNSAQVDMFASQDDRLARAYRHRARRVAFSESESERPGSASKAS